MRATGGTLKFRRSNSSRRICQMRPIAKPSESAAKISIAITTAKLIGFSPLGQGHHPDTQGYSIVLGSDPNLKFCALALKGIPAPRERKIGRRWPLSVTELGRGCLDPPWRNIRQEGHGCYSAAAASRASANWEPLPTSCVSAGGPSKHNGAKASIAGGGAKAFKVGDGRGDGVQSR